MLSQELHSDIHTARLWDRPLISISSFILGSVHKTSIIPCLTSSPFSYFLKWQVEGMRKACAGSLDKSPPKEILWKTVPHRLFFGRDQTKTWGPGGVAFLHPESNSQNRAHMCMYRITYVIFHLITHHHKGYYCFNNRRFLEDVNDLSVISLSA